uniref:Synaptobrevin, longin-like domain protein n=1 Tax=Tanacetum cinerariifolium TaxID=118510 RepID=A0A6L2KHW6_TANCI|nr:hypothetical protein [Tanacetum cinerariifolium]
MALTFADTHNMIAFLTKSDASEGFDQIVDFLTAHPIQYDLMVNPTIYVLCIKRFWALVSIKKSNDAVKLQALIDRKKVIITEDIIRQALQLDDADGIDCLPNEEIFVELARIGYEKPSTKLTFYKAFFLAQWKFLIHIIIQCMSANRTAWNEFSSSMASAIICLATVDGDMCYPDPEVANLEQDKIAQALEITKLKKRVRRVESSIETVVDDQEDASKHGEIAELDVDEDVTLEDMDAEVEIDANIQGMMVESQAKAYNLGLQHAEKVLSMHDTNEAEPNEVEEVLEVVIAAKLMTEVVTTAATITIVAQVPKPSASRKRRGVVIQDHEETTAPSVIIHSEEIAKKQRIDEEAEELKTHLQIVANDDDDVLTKATPLATKVPVFDYQIHHENIKPYCKIIRADGTHKLFLSFITLLRNFNREDLKTLWKLVKDIFESTEPQNFLDEFLLNILKIMFEKPNVKANMILLVEKKYPLIRFTLEQMLNNVRLEVEEESEMLLELLRLIRRQLNEGYVPE